MDKINVNFYHAYYKRQVYNEVTHKWEDTHYNHLGIIVIADSFNNAKIKINECLKRVSSDNCRAVLNSKIVECIGLKQQHGPDWTFEISPITRG